MGIYYFAVDYSQKKQMRAPRSYSDKSPGIFYPGHPLPCMVVMKNMQGWDFTIVNDVSTHEEHEFEDITEQVFKELKEYFPEYDWDNDL